MATEWQFGDLVEVHGTVAVVLGLAPANFEYTNEDGDEHNYIGGRHYVLVTIKPRAHYTQPSFGTPGSFLNKWAPKR